MKRLNFAEFCGEYFARKKGYTPEAWKKHYRLRLE
jgi:hypothetical protein